MKWHYTTIHFESMTELGLSAIEYIVSDITYHRSTAGTTWWSYSPEDIGELLGVDERTIRRIVDRCIEKKTIVKDHEKIISSQDYINVVYPLNGQNARPNGQNARLQTDKTPAYHNIYSKKEYSGLEDSPRPQIVEVSESSDLDGELGDSKSPRLSPDKRKAYDELIAWSENERGFEFPKTTRLVQYKAFKLANENQIPRERLMEMWEEMSCDKFWQKEGFDWMNVVHKCLKKPV